MTGLVPRVNAAIIAAFDPEHPLAPAPIDLEGLAFRVDFGDCRMSATSSYAELLSRARPNRTAVMAFLSPTYFNSRRDSTEPTPARCIGSYLRRWNAFAPVEIDTDTMRSFVETQVEVVRQELETRVTRMRFEVPRGPAVRARRRGDGKSRPPRAEPFMRIARGSIGQVEWRTEGGSSILLRSLDALLEYARFAGTGRGTAHGLGQSRRFSKWAPQRGFRDHRR